MTLEDHGRPVLRGAGIIGKYAAQLPDTPGVYRMLDEKGEPLYVGKAKSLKKRVSSYARPEKQVTRIQRMIAQTVSMEFVHTQTEVEALLLESNLIKKLKPRYNVLLRDDKSFPYILVTGGHDFPLVTKHRGARNFPGKYFGPFAGAGDVNRTIALLQRIFMLRNCTDSYFAQRTRPCLQYHIKRCTAPCVGKVTKDQYAEQVAQAQDFLEGKSQDIQKRMSEAMQKASAELNYEVAAEYRDRLHALASVQAHQDINMQGLENVDVMALHMAGGQSCVQVFFFRAGYNYGNRSYFPRHDREETPDAILGAFIAQFYENKPVPRELVVNYEPQEKALLEKALSLKTQGKLEICVPVRGQRKKALEFAERNAAAALERYHTERATEARLLEGLAKILDLDDAPSRIEVYDNSHISGTNMIGAMIVAGPDGFQKNAYRKFNIKQAGAADDYGMMREVLQRRFKKVLKEPDAVSQDDWPDVVLIDGGLGQFNAVKEILEEYGIMQNLTLVAIAKGEDRNAGRETFHMEGRAAFSLPMNDPILHYLQRLRDEAHRFAIGTHRARRSRQITSSPLDEIAGIGPGRKKALLHYFGSAKAVAEAGIDDLRKVEGISKAVAQKIHDHFRS
jgi:excinuclease ABC subunit C